MEVILALTLAVLTIVVIVRFGTWRGKRFSAHLYHWWVVRRGTRRMLRRAERVHRAVVTPGATTLGPTEASVEPVGSAPVGSTQGQPETVVLPPRNASSGGSFVTPSLPALRPDPKRARAEAEAQGLRIVSPSDEPDALAGWLLNAIGLSILLVLGLWLVNGGYSVVMDFIP